MMKQIIMILVFYLFMAGLYAQKWEHTIGLPNIDESSYSVIEHYDKGYIITGLLSSGYGDLHGLVVKTDINGNVLWDKTIGVNPDEVLIDKTIFDDLGNLYIFGTLKGSLDIICSAIIKLNACGEQEWCRLFYFEEYEYGTFYDGILLDNGDLLGLANLDNESQHDMIFLFCISPDGEYKWKKSYASCDNYPDFEMRLGSRIQFFDDIYIISGYTYAPHPNFPNTTSIRPMFIGIDTLFKEKWVLVFGMEDNMKGKALATIPINDSLFLGTGRYRYYGNSGQTQDAWAMIYNDKGEQVNSVVISKDQLGSENIESVLYEIEQINDSIYLSTAGFYFPDIEEYSTGEIVFDTTGKVYNYETNRIEGSSASTYLTKTYDQKYVTASHVLNPNLKWDIVLNKINENLEHDTVYPGNYTYDSLCPYQIESGEIDLTGCDIVTSIGEIPTLEQYRENLQSIGIAASPNPTSSGEVLLELENTASFTNMELHVTDVYGKNIHSENILPQQGAVRLQTGQWPAGMFVATVLSSGQVKGKAKFVVR